MRRSADNASVRNMASRFALLLTAVLLWPAQALAQAGFAPPTPRGGPHICSEYPYDALAAATGGATIVAFTIAKDGTVKDISVDRSSGSDALDQAALACAARWLYVPAERDGQWIEVPWKAQITSAVHQGDPDPIAAQSCHRYRGSEAERAAANKTALFVFWIDTNGHLTPPYLLRSSGSPSFDAAAADCIADWDFIAADVNGHSIDALLGAEIGLLPDASVSVADYLPKGHYCGPSWYGIGAQGFDGETALAFGIGAGGKTSDVKVTRPSGNAALDDAAVRCASSWIYRRAAAQANSVQQASVAAVPATAIVAWKGGRAYVLEAGDAK
jgi:TonB family protein